MEAAMHRKSFRAAYGFALLALALQLLALPASARHQAERLAVGQTEVCSPLGTRWVSTGDNAPAHETVGQTPCPLCNLSQHSPSLPGGSATFQAPGVVGRSSPSTALHHPVVKFSYFPAQPRAPPR